MEREDILDLLANISKLLEIIGENVLKVRVYENANRILVAYEGDFIKAIEFGERR